VIVPPRAAQFLRSRDHVPGHRSSAARILESARRERGALSSARIEKDATLDSRLLLPSNVRDGADERRRSEMKKMMLSMLVVGLSALTQACDIGALLGGLG